MWGRFESRPRVAGPGSAALIAALGLRVSNERHHASLRPEARDDMHVVGEDSNLVHVHLPAKCRLVDCGPHGVDVSATDEPLPEPRVPGDMDVSAECSMRHTHLG